MTGLSWLHINNNRLQGTLPGVRRVLASGLCVPERWHHFPACTLFRGAICLLLVVPGARKSFLASNGCL